MKVAATAKWKDKESGEEMSRTGEVEYEFGDDIHALIDAVTPEAVFHHAKASMIVSLQSALRQWVIQGLTEEEIETKVDEWSVPTGKPRGQSRLDRLRETLGKMSPEERAKLMEDMD